MTRHSRAVALAGLGEALWWLGDLRRSVECRERAYAEFRRTSDQIGAATVAMGLSITYRADLGNHPAARGWIARAERVVQGTDAGPLQGWLWMTRAYVTRDSDLPGALALQERALRFARDGGDVDLELVTVGDLGVSLVAKGDVDEGLALVDEAMAGALGGERSRLITVVYTGCEMLVACDLAGDLDRASQWCKVVDRFVADYGCPFLYVECRTLYGSLLLAKGHWDRAERELAAALAMSADVAPGLHELALVRLADLRFRQGRIEEAEALLRGVRNDRASLLLVAAVRLARGEPAGQAALLERRARSLTTPCLDIPPVLAMLVDVHLAQGEVDDGTAAARRLAEVAATLRHRHPAGLAARASGRVAAARGDRDLAASEFERALDHFTALDLPYETARVRLELARVVAESQPGLAATEARTALAEFDRLGAAADADAAASLLRLLGVGRRARQDQVGVRVGWWPGRSPGGSRRCSSWSGSGCPTPRSHSASSSAERPRVITSAACSPSWVCETVPRRSRTSPPARSVPGRHRSVDRLAGPFRTSPTATESVRQLQTRDRAATTVEV